MDSFYSQEELGTLGFKSLGEDVKISRNTCIYGAGNISIGSHVRIDDFCRLSGNITIGNYVHISSYSALWGGEAGISIGDFVTFSSRITVFAQSDDFSGMALTNPTVPDKYKNTISQPVVIKKHAIIGATSVVLPNVVIEEGTACGAMSLLKKSTEPWSVYAGIPAKKLYDRKKDLLDKEKEFFNEMI